MRLRNRPAQDDLNLDQEPSKTSRGRAKSSNRSSGETTERVYYLIFEDSPVPGFANTRTTLDFTESNPITVGRDQTNTIAIPDPDVSRHHAQFTLDGTRVLLRDLGSTNGTFLHDGADYRQVRDDVPVKLKSMIRFGTNTTVRLTRETETQYEH